MKDYDTVLAIFGFKMMSIRKWLYKPKKTDSQLLAQFYFSDEELIAVSQELDSFDGRQDPERCTLLVNQLRACQDKVLAIVEQVMEHAIANERANRDFRAKFPDDVLQESLAGQLWFGAECLAAGSTIMNREIESAALRPLARGLTRSLDVLRSILREQCYKDLNHYSNKCILRTGGLSNLFSSVSSVSESLPRQKKRDLTGQQSRGLPHIANHRPNTGSQTQVKESLRKFDEMFSEFELSYVSAMVPVKTAREFDTQQDVIVLFCETVDRALKQGYITQERVDDYDPALMFTIPRLAIVSGLLVFPEGPLNMDRDPRDISELFRPFHGLLRKIRELLETLHDEELHLLEKALCSTKDSWDVIERQLNEMSLNNETPPRGRSRRTSRNPDSICLSPCDSMLTECSIISSSFMSTPEGADLLMQRLSFSESNHELMARELESGDGEASGIDIVVPGISAACTSSKESKDDKNSGAETDRNEASLEDHLPENPDGQQNCDVANNNFFGLQTSRNDSNSVARENETDSLEPPQRRSRVPRLTREDSGLGSAPELESMDLFINVQPMLPSSVEIELHDGTGLVRVQHSVSAPHSSKTNPSPLRIDGQLQDKRNCSINTNGHDRPPVTSPTGSEFAPKFSRFGKGKPSTELSLVGARTSPTVNNRNHLDFTNEGPASPSHRISNQSSIDEPSPSEPNEPTSFFQRIRHGSGHRGSDQELSRASSINGAISASAINRVEGSRGVRRMPIPGARDYTQCNDDDGSLSSSCSSSCCEGDDDICNYQWESDGSDSDSTSYLSENNDELEIAMAIEAAEMAARQEMRSHFRSSSDLVHRLFVCIAGVADQLQTNYASDLRNILKTVFIMCAAEPLISTPDDQSNKIGSSPDEPFNGVPSTSAATPNTVASRNNGVGGSPESNASPTNGRVRFDADANSQGAVGGDLGSLNDLDSHSETEGLIDSTKQTRKAAYGYVSARNTRTGSNSSDVNSRISPGDSSVFEGAAEGESPGVEPKERKRHRSGSRNRRSGSNQEPPPWVPDDSATECTSCKATFTMLRRKHHCRNCGKIFCGRCSANSVPLPRYGQLTPVRVCNGCYMFQVTPFQT